MAKSTSTETLAGIELGVAQLDRALVLTWTRYAEQESAYGDRAAFGPVARAGRAALARFTDETVQDRRSGTAPESSLDRLAAALR